MRRLKYDLFIFTTDNEIALLLKHSTGCPKASGLFLFVEDTITLGLTCPPGIRILFLLEDSAFKYTPSYDEVKHKFITDT